MGAPPATIATSLRSIVGVGIAAWPNAGDDPGTDYLALIDAAMAQLEAGLPV
jgi:hypothetical protein